MAVGVFCRGVIPLPLSLLCGTLPRTRGIRVIQSRRSQWLSEERGTPEDIFDILLILAKAEE